MRKQVIERRTGALQHHPGRRFRDQVRGKLIEQAALAHSALTLYQNRCTMSLLHLSSDRSQLLEQVSAPHKGQTAQWMQRGAVCRLTSLPAQDIVIQCFRFSRGCDAKLALKLRLELSILAQCRPYFSPAQIQ